MNNIRNSNSGRGSSSKLWNNLNCLLPCTEFCYLKKTLKEWNKLYGLSITFSFKLRHGSLILSIFLSWAVHDPKKRGIRQARTLESVERPTAFVSGSVTNCCPTLSHSSPLHPTLRLFSLGSNSECPLFRLIPPRLCLGRVLRGLAESAKAFVTRLKRTHIFFVPCTIFGIKAVVLV